MVRENKMYNMHDPVYYLSLSGLFVMMMMMMMLFHEAVEAVEVEISWPHALIITHCILITD